mmetsp:Transcript_76315/g.166611  ORF Transcript_76315/g.166611 Transcript_76315/m.166611 type:complete len:265 (-) Transcript_76315:561-1355(-)
MKRPRMWPFWLSHIVVTILRRRRPSCVRQQLSRGIYRFSEVDWPALTTRFVQRLPRTSSSNASRSCCSARRAGNGSAVTCVRLRSTAPPCSSASLACPLTYSLQPTRSSPPSTVATLPASRSSGQSLTRRLCSATAWRRSAAGRSGKQKLNTRQSWPERQSVTDESWCASSRKQRNGGNKNWSSRGVSNKSSKGCNKQGSSKDRKSSKGWSRPGSWNVSARKVAGRQPVWRGGGRGLRRRGEKQKRADERLPGRGEGMRELQRA